MNKYLTLNQPAIILATPLAYICPSSATDETRARGDEATEVLTCPPDEQFQTYAPTRREKLPREKQIVSGRELKAAMQSLILVCNIQNELMARAVISQSVDASHLLHNQIAEGYPGEA
jgi:hypothetical protein